MAQREEAWHVEARFVGKPMPTGWEMACGRSSPSFVGDPADEIEREAVTCKSCLKILEKHHGSS